MAFGISALFWGIITLSLLVLVHEGGHFFAARAFGIRVREFMIGLPGPKLSWKSKNTLYGVTAIPLGGYVKVVGMEGDQHNPLNEAVLAYITAKREVEIEDLAEHFNVNETKMYSIVLALRDLQAVTMKKNETIRAVHPLEAAEDPDALYQEARADSYLTLPAWKRIVILLSGILLNLVMAIAVFTVVFSLWGMYQDVGHVIPVPGAPADLAGVPAEARIVTIDGVAVSNFDELTAQIQTHQVGDSVTLEYQEPGVAYSNEMAYLTVTATLVANPDSGLPFLGVSPHFVKVRMSPIAAIATSFEYLWLTAKAIAGFFNPASFTQTIDQSASVVGIAVIAAEAVKAGPYEYAGLIAAISLSLGLMNLLPIPPLDGGKIVLELIEKIRRKPLSLNVSLGISAVGFSLLFTLMAYLLYNDFTRFIAR